MTDKRVDDYYEVLQLNPNADPDMIERVYRLLAKRFHPDNQVTGNVDRFNQLREAYSVLSDPESRAAYDVHYDETRAQIWQVFDQDSAGESFEGDKRVFDGLLALLYVQRRRDVDHPGMGTMELERLLGCPAEHLDFHIWYLKKKEWIEVLETGQVALTVTGVDEVVSGSLLLLQDRLLKSADGDVESPDGGPRGPAQLDEGRKSTDDTG